MACKIVRQTYNFVVIGDFGFNTFSINNNQIEIDKDKSITSPMQTMEMNWGNKIKVRCSLGRIQMTFSDLTVLDFVKQRLIALSHTLSDEKGLKAVGINKTLIFYFDTSEETNAFKNKIFPHNQMLADNEDLIYEIGINRILQNDSKSKLRYYISNFDRRAIAKDRLEDIYVFDVNNHFQINSIAELEEKLDLSLRSYAENDEFFNRIIQ